MVPFGYWFLRLLYIFFLSFALCVCRWVRSLWAGRVTVLSFPIYLHLFRVPKKKTNTNLLLCSRFAPSYSFIVCNLTTQKYTVLSPPTWPSKLPRLARLAFDPSESPHYKVVSVSRDPYQIDFYSSHSACWRQVFVQDKCYGHGVFWNGAIHLLSDENALWRFDADVEKLITMPKPPTSGFLDKILYFGEWVGSLILITLVDSESLRWMGTPIVGLSSVGSILDPQCC